MTGLFDDLFRAATPPAHTLEQVKTTNMGTLYELQLPHHPEGGAGTQGVSGCPAVPQREPEHSLLP